MKVLRILIYVVLRLFIDLLQIFAFPFFCIVWFMNDVEAKSDWHKGINNRTLRGFIPFHTTIKTVKQIWVGK